MEIGIRPAIAQDYEALCRIIDQVDALHRRALPHIFREPAGPVCERVYMLGLMADEGTALLVAEFGGQKRRCAMHVLTRSTRAPTRSTAWPLSSRSGRWT